MLLEALLCATHASHHPVFLFFSLLISFLGLHGICTAADQTTNNSQTVAYAYVGSSAPGQPDYSQGIITDSRLRPMVRPSRTRISPLRRDQRPHDGIRLRFRRR